jgi:hypothetical protein
MLRNVGTGLVIDAASATRCENLRTRHGGGGGDRWSRIGKNMAAHHTACNTALSIGILLTP